MIDFILRDLSSVIHFFLFLYACFDTWFLLSCQYLDYFTCHVDLTVLKLLISRTSQSEFIVSVNKYLEARNHKLSVGMRFKMRFEGEEVPERR